MPTLAAPHLFTREDYHKMVASGVLTADDRVELIHGEILEKMPIGPSHGGCVKRLNYFFTRLAGDSVIVSVQDPLALGAYSEPQPDLALLRPRPDFYADSHPEAADVLLLIEVSDSSIMFDRRTKLPLYATYGIPEVWIVDLSRREITVHRDPAADRYREESVYRRATPVPLGLFPGHALTAEDIGL